MHFLTGKSINSRSGISLRSQDISTSEHVRRCPFDALHARSTSTNIGYPNQFARFALRCKSASGSFLEPEEVFAPNIEPAANSQKFAQPRVPGLGHTTFETQGGRTRARSNNASQHVVPIATTDSTRLPLAARFEGRRSRQPPSRLRRFCRRLR